MNPAEMFTMTGEEAYLWAEGKQVGTLTTWRLLAGEDEGFLLDAIGADLGGWAELPAALRPALQVRFRIGKGWIVAPVQMVDRLHYRGSSRPVAIREV